jgi:hypothetical protein
MLELKLFKLVTGETIICYEPEIIESTANGVEHVFKRPLMLVLQPSEQGIQMGLLPWMGQETLVKNTAIIAHCDAPPPVEQQYIKMTTNIQLAR